MSDDEFKTKIKYSVGYKLVYTVLDKNSDGALNYLVNNNWLAPRSKSELIFTDKKSLIRFVEESFKDVDLLVEEIKAMNEEEPLETTGIIFKVNVLTGAEACLEVEYCVIGGLKKKRQIL